MPHSLSWRKFLGVFIILIGCGSAFLAYSMLYWLNGSALDDASLGGNGVLPPPFPISTSLLAVGFCLLLGLGALLLAGAGSILLVSVGRAPDIRLTWKQTAAFACVFLLLLGGSTFYSPYQYAWGSVGDGPPQRNTAYGFPATAVVAVKAQPGTGMDFPPAQPVSDVFSSWSTSDFSSAVAVNALFYLFLTLDIFVLGYALAFWQVSIRRRSARRLNRDSINSAIPEAGSQRETNERL